MRRTLERTQWSPLAGIRAYQEHRLKTVLQHAYDHVPYYRNLFRELGIQPSDIRGIDGLRQLPLLSGETVRKRRREFLSDNASRYHTVVYRTSGTSGTPMEIYRDRFANSLEFAYYWRHWSWGGYRLGDRFAELGSLHFVNRDSLQGAASSWQPHLGRLMLNSTLISHARAVEIADAIRRHRPRFLKGLPSAVYFLALCFKERRISDISFQAVFTTGETLTPLFRDMAESVFHCRVLDSYGQMEGAVTIAQCMEGGYHVNSDYGLLELDSTAFTRTGNAVVVPVVGTSLHNLSMPMIRYVVGDYLELCDSPVTCLCGRTLPLVKAIHGRSEDIIVTPDGRFVTSLFVVPELAKGLRFVQFVQEAEDLLCVNVIPLETWDEAEEKRLVHTVRKFVGDGIKVAVHRIGPDEVIIDASGKLRTVISRVKGLGDLRPQGMDRANCQMRS
ncbi:MAG: hypothetical protein AB1512_14335 [Thermodesulfobacteriota bacterium]